MLTLNRIPIRSWSWLKVNETIYEGPMPEVKEYSLDPLKKVPEEVKLEENIEIPEAWKGEEDFYKFALENRNMGYRIEVEDNKRIEDIVILDYKLNEENPFLLDFNKIIVGENSSLNILFIYTSDKGEFFHGGLTEIEVKAGGHLSITKLQLLEEESGDIDFIRINQGENSVVDTKIIELGSAETIGNWESNMIGSEAKTMLETIYLGKNKEKLDFNYRMNHKARNTEGFLLGNGVLFDEAEKTFRDTIDFQRGSGQSTSEETENILLLSDKSINKSVPLLLCVEDNVEGAHAAVTGSFDEEALFYLMTRGISKYEAEKLLIKARLVPTINKIEDEKSRSLAISFLERRLDGEEY